MISLRKPSADTVRAFLATQSNLGFSYGQVGATATVPPPGYVVDHTRVRLGSGERAFESAKAALGRWEQFRLGWLEAWSPDDPIKVGGAVAVAGRSLGVWWLNACRIVYVVDDGAGPVVRFGFAYGTLPAHIERGEERFLVEWDRAGDGGVWFDVLAFSRPRHVLARLGRPWVRRLQKRFGPEAAESMARSVAAGDVGG
jgi:uncharacterized protein (UPF0548 family)